MLTVFRIEQYNKLRIEMKSQKQVSQDPRYKLRIEMKSQKQVSQDPRFMIFTFDIIL